LGLFETIANKKQFYGQNRSFCLKKELNEIYRQHALFLSIKFYFCGKLKGHTMYWTLELASYLEDAPWPATKEELIDYAIRTGAPLEVVENLQELEDDGQPFESIEEIWPDYPTKEDFFFNEDEY
jgi:hypothetical protein